MLLKMIKTEVWFLLSSVFPPAGSCTLTSHSVDVLLIIVAVNSNVTGGFKPCCIGSNATSTLTWLIFRLIKLGSQLEILLFTTTHVKKKLSLEVLFEVAVLL